MPKSIKEPKRLRVLSKPVTDVAAVQHCGRLAAAFFNDASMGREILFKLSTAAAMYRGAEAHHRPAIRRDKLEAAANAARRLTAHLAALDAQTIADAMGRVAPVWEASGDDTSNPLTAGLTMATAVPSQAPALLEAYYTMLQTLGRLGAGLTALSQRPVDTRRGAAETPDALMFALEGLAALWAGQKNQALTEINHKRGQFGDFATQALALLAHLWTPSQISTGLRRLQEAQVTTA